VLTIAIVRRVPRDELLDESLQGVGFQFDKGDLNDVITTRGFTP
jgi:hypothetical protein